MKSAHCREKNRDKTSIQSATSFRLNGQKVKSNWNNKNCGMGHESASAWWSPQQGLSWPCSFLCFENSLKMQLMICARNLLPGFCRWKKDPQLNYRTYPRPPFFLGLIYLEYTVGRILEYCTIVSPTGFMVLWDKKGRRGTVGAVKRLDMSRLPPTAPPGNWILFLSVSLPSLPSPRPLLPLNPPGTCAPPLTGSWDGICRSRLWFCHSSLD